MQTNRRQNSNYAAHPQHTFFLRTLSINTYSPQPARDTYMAAMYMWKTRREMKNSGPAFPVVHVIRTCARQEKEGRKEGRERVFIFISNHFPLSACWCVKFPFSSTVGIVHVNGGGGDVDGIVNGKMCEIGGFSHIQHWCWGAQKIMTWSNISRSLLFKVNTWKGAYLVVTAKSSAWVKEQSTRQKTSHQLNRVWCN
jgi:hypothetical protein